MAPGPGSDGLKPQHRPPLLPPPQTLSETSLTFQTAARYHFSGVGPERAWGWGVGTEIPLSKC